MKIKNNKIKYFNEKNIINKYLLRKNYLKSFFIFFKYISVFACIFFLGNEIFINYLDILENLKSNSIENKLILLKASRGIGLEEIVKYL
jgi:hypothetical protein